jgi:hypothetical protein
LELHRLDNGYEIIKLDVMRGGDGMRSWGGEDFRSERSAKMDARLERWGCSGEEVNPGAGAVRANQHLAEIRGKSGISI